jgi:hypothetical protein
VTEHLRDGRLWAVVSACNLLAALVAAIAGEWGSVLPSLALAGVSLIACTQEREIADLKRQMGSR